MLTGLYVLTDSKHYPHKQWPERVEKVILAGANIIQLRDKSLSPQQLLPHAQTLKEICQHYGVLLIINDYVQLAKRVNADGVHIGQHDTSLREARNYLGNQYIIGVSCYKRLIDGVRAQNLGADYVAFGSMFSSYTKSNAARCSLSIISQAKRSLSIPVCAIGGINQRNASYVINAGADMLAISHAVFNAHDPYNSANKITQQVIMSG